MGDRGPPGPAGGMAPGVGDGGTSYSIDTRPAKNLRPICRACRAALRRDGGEGRRCRGPAAAWAAGERPARGSGRPRGPGAGGAPPSGPRCARAGRRCSHRRGPDEPCARVGRPQPSAWPEAETQPALVRAGQTPVELAGDGELGLAAGERRLQLLAQRAAGAKDQCLDGARRQLEDLGDLCIRAALELAHYERRTLVEGEMAERAADVLGARAFVFLRRADETVADVLVEGDLRRPARGLAKALPADVVRDRDQPVLRLLRPLPALEGTEGVEERRLSDVLRVRLVAHHRERVAIDVGDMPPVEPLEGAVRARALRQQGRHLLLDTHLP